MLTTEKSFGSLLALIFCLSFFAPFAIRAQSKAQFPDAADVKGSTITYTVIEGQNRTFGYDIYRDKKLLIHQPAKPGMPGNKGFATKTDAAKVAELVIKKIKNGELPPGVSKEEMAELDISLTAP